MLHQSSSKASSVLIQVLFGKTDIPECKRNLQFTWIKPFPWTAVKLLSTCYTFSNTFECFHLSALFSLHLFSDITEDAVPKAAHQPCPCIHTGITSPTRAATEASLKLLSPPNVPYSSGQRGKHTALQTPRLTLVHLYHLQLLLWRGKD